MAQKDYLTIGEVVAKLQSAYPDLTTSKVRYLEDEGLISPNRSPSGYRKFSPADVDRLSAILRLQKTQFYPLAVIKEKLDKADAEGSEYAGLGEGDFENDLKDLENRMHPIENIPDLLGIDIGFVRRLSDTSLITLSKSPKGRDLVDGKDLALIRAAFEMSRFGVQPRHLRTLATSINKESFLFEQVLSSFKRTTTLDEEEQEDNAKQIETTLVTMERLTNIIRGSLLRKQLRRRFGEI